MAVQWEYTTVLATHDREKNAWLVLRIGDTRVPDQEKNKTLLEHLNDLGSQGWEVVSSQVEEPQHSTQWHYMFIPIPYAWSELQTQTDTYKGTEGFGKFFNEIGDDGWELCSVMEQYDTFWHPTSHIAIFRKQWKWRHGRYLLKRQTTLVTSA